MPSKYQDIIDVKKANPELSWTQAANQAGYEGKWTASGTGGVKPRTGDRRSQTRRRSTSVDQTSTPLAAAESKQIKKESTRVSAQAQMFGLEPTQIEHLADQGDVKELTSGAAGDPTNLKQVKQSEARFKDAVKLKVPEGYAVTLNPATESVRVIPKKFFDPIADPATLPGTDIPIGSDIDKALANLQPPTTKLLSQFSPEQQRQLRAAPDLEAQEKLIKQFKSNKGLTAARLARNVAPAMLSVPLGLGVAGQSAAAAVQDPTQDNVVNAGFDVANSLADLVGLIPTPMTVAASEGVQRALMLGQMTYNSQRTLQRLADMKNK